MFTWLYEYFLPLYIPLWPNYWLAIWSAPVLSYGGWKPHPDWKPQTHWQALRITLRRGKFHEHLLMTMKRDVL